MCDAFRRLMIASCLLIGLIHLPFGCAPATSPNNATAATETDKSKSKPAPVESVKEDSFRNSSADNGSGTNDLKITAPGPTSWATFRNGNRQLGVAGSPLPEDLDLLWEHPAPDGMVTAAAIVGDYVYAGILHGDLLCLNRRTGDLIWSYRSIDDPDPKQFAPGFKAAPTVTADSVYIGDEDGILHAVDRATGKMKWRFTTGAEIAGSVAVVGERLVFGSHDSFLYCLNREDGGVVWKFQTEDRVNCSPAIEGNFTFVAGCDTRLRVIDIESHEQKGMIPLGESAYLIASPAVVENMLYVGTHDGRVVGVDWKEGRIVWTFHDPKREQPFHASAAVTEEFVIVGGQDKQLHCLDRQTGDQVWAFPVRGQINSSAAVAGDRIFFGSDDGNVYGVNLRDGKEFWKYNAGKDVTASAAIGEGCLVIGTAASRGSILCFGSKSE